jgi:hypothetical protein
LTWNNSPITISGATYTISSVTDSNDLILSSSAGIQNGATYSTPGSATTCTPHAPIFSDFGLTAPIANPFNSDGRGNFGFFAATATTYTIAITGNSVSRYLITWTAPSSGPIGFAGAPTGSCTNIQTAVNTLTGDYYSCVGGAWIKVGPGGNPGVLSSPVVTPNPLALDVDLHFKGPNPWVDVTRYGVRSIATNAIPAITGITGSINSGQATLTVSTSSCPSQTGSACFVNGDGIAIGGAGPTQSMTTPSAPTVTPASPFAGMLQPGFVTAGPTGSTTYNYKIVAMDKGRGYTAASVAGTTTTGVATLGAQASVTISTLSRAAGGNTTTVVTSSNHNLVAGEIFRIGGTTNDGNFGGWYNVASVTNNTTFTFTSGLWNYTSVAVTGTGGTLLAFAGNSLTWPAVTGAWQYGIYSDRASSGNFALIGVSLVAGPFSPAPTSWVDYGSPMMDGFLFSPFIPTAAPSVAANDLLVTTISSGAGTTTLTLAANAGTTVAGATVLFDNTPNLKAAGTANSHGSPLFFPTGGYVFNSFCDMTGSFNYFIQNGSLLLNDTLSLQAGTLWWGDRPSSWNSAASFSWEGVANINVNRAYPGVYVNTANSTAFRSIQVSLSANAGLGMLLENGNNVAFENSTFSSGGGAGDYTGIGLFFNGADDGSSSIFGIYFSKVTFASTQSINTAVPMFYCRACGTGVFRSLSGGGRGMAFSAQTTSGAGPFTFDGAFHYQAGNAPLIMSTGGALVNTGAGSFNLQNITLDTMANPMFTTFNVSSQTPTIKITGGAGPSSGIPNFTGTSIGQLIADWNAPTSGQNMNVLALSGKGASLIGTKNVAANIANPSGGIGVAGTSGMGYLFPQPAAPTIVVGGHGSCVSNCVAAGTYFYSIVANDINQGQSSISPVSISATTDGTQSITVSWVLLNGQVSTNTCRGSASFNQNCSFVQGSGTTGTSYVDASTIGYTVSAPGSGGGFSEGLSAQGFAGHAITLTPVPFASLSTPSNGTFYFCPDCTIANPCAGGGNGAFAKRLNGVWVCN